MPLWTLRTDYGADCFGDESVCISSYSDMDATGAKRNWPRGMWWRVGTGPVPHGVVWRLYAELSSREDEEARLMP